MLCGTACLQQQVPQHLDYALANGSLFAQPLILLASHSIALTRKSKNPSQIAREIQFFALSPRWSQSIFNY